MAPISSRDEGDIEELGLSLRHCDACANARAFRVSYLPSGQTRLAGLCCQDRTLHLMPVEMPRPRARSGRAAA